MKKLYKFGKYPLTPIINKKVGMLGVDTHGNLVEIGARLQDVIIIDSPLRKDFSVEGLTDVQANILFSLLNSKYENRYGITIYTNKMKFNEE